MQGLHHHQQQLAGLLSVALAKDPSTTSSITNTTAIASSSDEDESSRISAIKSIHRSILYPSNFIYVAQSAAFLSQGFSTLLSDKSYSVRQAAATANAALCSVVCSILISPNDRFNHALISSLVDRFISWVLPLVSNGNGGEEATELALESLHEFLNVGDVMAIERYVLPILKSFQELVEDERTSMNLLRRVLDALSLISLKFSRSFQPHFVDIVDLLLGWALVPDLADLDRHVIMDSFLQFHKHWVNNLPFSLGLLSKFLGDMDVLVQDKSPGTPQYFRKLLALLSCFLTVLQSTASGLLEMNILEQILEPLNKLIPQLLGCLSMVSMKFGWSKWVGDLWRCATLLAEILGDKFSTFYPKTVDILFKSLEIENFTSLQVHGVLKTNLQLLSLQKHGLLPPSVQKILQFDAPISQLRLHPNHLVAGSSAATYIFFLQHGNNKVVEQAMTSLTEELLLLKNMLEKNYGSTINHISYSKQELFSLIKFDLKVMQSCICLNGGGSLITENDIAAVHISRSNSLTSFILEKLNPFVFPILGCTELQVSIMKTLDKIAAVEFLSSYSIKKQTTELNFGDLITEHLKKYSVFLIKALEISSPLPVKLESLGWICRFCEGIIGINDKRSAGINIYESYGYVGINKSLVFSVLDDASDREPKVRSQVALVLELLLQARLIPPTFFYPISEVILEKLGDSHDNIKNAYLRLLSHILPITVYACGLSECDTVTTCGPNFIKLENSSYLHWKQVFSLKQLPRHLRSQQLVSILSYISQRWKVPLSSWVQRLINNCPSSKEFVPSQLEEIGETSENILQLDIKVEEDLLDRIWSVNNLVGAFWAIHEASRYCISTRLRTNLGGPTQTFAALERMLLDIVHLLQLETKQSDGNMNMLGTTSSCAHLLPMRLLLDFVEALKKNVYNAYDGSVVLPCATRQSSLFFRANKKVCEEWFSRICEPMMNVGLALHCHKAVIHYCTLRLQEMRNLVISALKDKSRAQITENLHNIRSKYTGDILRVLRHMALSLCKVREPESLVGLQNWVSLTFSSLFVENQSLGQKMFAGSFSWINGLVYQSSGQYEKAVAYFTHLLQTEDSLDAMGSESVHFVIARIIECYTAISDWKSLESWLLELQTLRAKHMGKSYFGALTTTGNELNALHALARFDEGDFRASRAYLDLTPKSSCELTLDCKLALQRSEQMLLQAMLYQAEGKIDNVSHEIVKAKSMLEETMSILPLDELLEAVPYATQLHCISAFEEGYNCIKESEENPKQLQSILSSYLKTMRFPIYSGYQDCSPWLKVLRVYQMIAPTSSVTLKFSWNLLRLSRKQGNLGLANRLESYLRDNVDSCNEEKYRVSLISMLQYEGTLLKHAENNLEDSITNLWLFVRPSVFPSTNTGYYDSDVSVLKAKACLKLASWLRQDFSDENVGKLALMIQQGFKQDDSSIGLVGPSSDKSSFGPNTGVIIEEIIGTLTKLSSRLCPHMGKSWMSYAFWCYNQARASLSTSTDTVVQSCSFSPFLSQEVITDRFKLTEEEKLNIESIILQIFHKNEAIDDKSMNALLHQTVNIIEAAAGAPGAENLIGDCLAVTLASQFITSFLQANADLKEIEIRSSIDSLVNVWWSLRKRRVSLFGQAAYGFIQYLSYSSAKICNISGSEFLKQKGESYTLRATLHVLQILLNFGVELKDTLEPALLTVPLLPWQEITPQLFARLSSHPEHVIRKQLEGLVMMLAKQYPWSIVYPTLVDVNSYEEGPCEELQHLLAGLTKLYPRLVEDVQLMINELGNATVLWEELWLSTLQELHTDVMRRISLLKEEARRIFENITLSHNEKNKINASKYSALMAPIVVALERRLASTSRKPETPHETWFQQMYGEQLKSAIFTFKTPPASASSLSDMWRPFDSIATSLATCQRKSSISLGEIAPQLASLSSSDVPMPGLEKQVSESERSFVTVSSFLEQVTILSTKTKPKKLVMLGSDGKKYTYLLKGREDLRLDARIMQLLKAINGICHSSRYSSALGIRYYSVTPISGRAGLIQWVDNVVSIYSVFKSWQNRVQQAQLSAMGGGNIKDSVPPPLPRPSDMFYGKIIPALKEKGIRRVISRRDWPQDVKRKVLLDLMKETPKQLLHQELWCASEGYHAFSSKLKRYSGSLAAMSMVGHILGLGDRHLDNILIDLYSGDIIHIDYNICFDKGQRLKIPEIVPFRLTQMMEGTLGLSGVEGTFRANCEVVLGVLRKNKDILMMLLEVFVWDPLVEWTRGDFHDDAAIGGEERKGMELAVSLSLFASRVQEIRVPLQEHHDLLLATLPAVESALEEFADALHQFEHASNFFHQVDEERSNLILNESSAKSIVDEATATLGRTLASYEVHAQELAEVKAVIMEKAQEATTWLEQHGVILEALRGSLIPDMNASIKHGSTDEALSLTSAVLTARVPLTIVPEPTQVQCQDIDKEVSQLVNDLDHGFSCAVTALHAYSLALQRILPLNYISTSPVHGWVQVLQLLSNSVSVDVLAVAKSQASELIEKSHGNNLDSVKQFHNGLCLKVEKYALEIKKVEEECAELENSIDSEAETKAKEQLMSVVKKYIMSYVRPGKFKHDGIKEKEKFLHVLNIALTYLYGEVKNKVVDIFSGSNVGINTKNNLLDFDFGTIFREFEEQIEKCILVSEFINELRHVIDLDVDQSNNNYERDWALTFKSCLLCCKSLVWQMTEVVLPDIIRSVISLHSITMDAFGSISQIRGSIDMALEQLIELEIERASLKDLEQNYSVKVGLITEQQLALEEAAMMGRDNLSWEEAEELASQEEACRVQLYQLHQRWNQKEMQTSILNKQETGVKNAFMASLNHFQSLITSDDENGPHVLGSKALLCKIAKPFSELESIDRALSSLFAPVASYPNEVFKLADLMSSGNSISEEIWKVDDGLISSHSFFIWEVAVVDYFLDSCIHDVASYIDQKLGFDQLFNAIKKKLEKQLQQHVCRYLKERVAPALLACLDKQNDHFTHIIKETNELSLTQDKTDVGDVKRVQIVLDKYCNAHESVRVARSASSLMKRQLDELREALYKTSLEIVQMEWIHDEALSIWHNNRVISQKFLSVNDNLYSIILNLSRPKLLETIQASVSKIVRSLESLQACERTSVTAESQLERAMGWACGGSGIPAEFHNHLMSRQQLLWEAREKASAILKICMSVVEFEVSRDGIFQIPEKNYSVRSGDEARTWQQNYVNALSKLDITYYSFTCTEQELKLAQSSMEAASNNLISATHELRAVSVKTKSASGDMQSTVLAMSNCAYDANVSLSAFSRIIRDHTALTSECGSMLEEVLAISEGLHDVHNLGKEAAGVHRALVEDISKANTILHPLELMLSKDVAAMTDAMAKERETKTELPPIHGQAIYQSYCLKIREAYNTFKPLVPPLTFSVKGLHSLLTSLARTASLHAGNLHKALEGLGESQEVRSQEINLSRPTFTGDAPDYDSKEGDSFYRSEEENTQDFPGFNKLPFQENGWISPPSSIYSSSTESDIISAEDRSLLGSNHESEEAINDLNSVPFDGTDFLESPDLVKALVSPNDKTIPVHGDVSNGEDSNEKGRDEDELSSENQLKIRDKEKQNLHTNTDFDNCVSNSRGKNPYAMSVLRRVEMKIDGQDIADNREVSVAEQVNYLLRQATSVDNLCNMYEGWTPWI